MQYVPLSPSRSSRSTLLRSPLPTKSLCKRQTTTQGQYNNSKNGTNDSWQFSSRVPRTFCQDEICRCGELTISSCPWEGKGRRTMKANAVALRPPAISSTTPRSQVINDTIHQLSPRRKGGGDILAMVENTTQAVTIICLFCENGRSLKKYSSITSRQT